LSQVWWKREEEKTKLLREQDIWKSKGKDKTKKTSNGEGSFS
jgi:hypothetical protein